MAAFAIARTRGPVAQARSGPRRRRCRRGALCRTWLALFLGLIAASPLRAARKGATPVVTATAILLENESCRYAIGTDGSNQALVNLADGTDYAQPDQPFMLLCQKGKVSRSTGAELAGDTAVVSFGDAGVQVRARLGIRPRYFTIAIDAVSGEDVDWLQCCNLRLSITQSLGPLVNAAWDDRFAVCVLACNDRTHSYGADESRAVLQAKCYREFGLAGAKIAIVAVPRPALLPAIETVELDQGLPHPVLNGVWIKQAPERFASYLMVHGVGEANIDGVVEFARGGFGCIEIYPWRSTPGYELNPALFPHGMAGLKAVADKVHKAGLQLGLHTMQGMVGWGPKNDPYIVPKADPRLLQNRFTRLRDPLLSGATELAVSDSTAGWPECGDLYIEGEVVQYQKRLEGGFAECQRGLHSTTVGTHAAGARVGLLVNCFPLWGHTVYCPDVNSTMVDEVCDRIAAAFNEVGADMSYFDGGEEIAVQPPHWRNQGRIALGVMQRLKKPVILEGNALYTNLAWHVITRGSPHFDPIYFGRRIYTLRHKGQNPAHWARNLLTGDVGWFHPHVRSLTTDAVTPDEVMLLCLKALGGNAPISFSMNAANPWENRRMPEMLEIIRACDELKRRAYFSTDVLAALVKPMAEHWLEQTPEGQWAVRPLQFGPARVVDAGRPNAGAWTCTNPFPGQTPWVRVRAQTQLAPYGARENLVLADFAEAPPLTPVDTSSPDLVQTAETSAEKTPDGASSFCYRAENRGTAASAWCRLSYRFPKPLDLSNHRRLGLWLRTEATGGILNVQLAATDARRDHYVTLNATGWTYVVLDQPEDSRFFEYRWPYSFTDLMYTCQPVYSPTKELNLYLNGVPAGTTARCWISRIEALQEKPLPVQMPSLEAGGQRLVFPVCLKTDEYLELDWTGQCHHFEANGGLLGQVRPEGTLGLAPGENRVRFDAAPGDAASRRAEITVALRGPSLPNPPAGATARLGRWGRSKAQTAYPSLAAEPAAMAGDLRPLPDGRGGYRLMQGVYQRVADDPVHSPDEGAADSSAWTLQNDRTQARPAALLLTCAAEDPGYHDPHGLTIDAFADVAAYAMSPTNAFEKYVIGEGKQFDGGGPVRAGVTHHLVNRSDAGRGSAAGAVYTATNDAAPGGWSAMGRRFSPALDLSRFARAALWVHGDANGETLKIQWRDAAGRYSDWVMPVDYRGWRLQQSRLEATPEFDWHQVEYVIVYYNNLPKATCEVRLDGLRALPPAGKPPVLRRLSFTLNGRRLSLPALGPGEALVLDGNGRARRCVSGQPQGRATAVAGGALELQPGLNQLELACGDKGGSVARVQARVIPLAP